MSKQIPKQLTLVHSVQITPNMQRLTFKGDALANFQQDVEGGYLKLLFTPNGETDLSELRADEQPIKRTFTIRQFLAEQQTLEIDFVRHETNSQACGFASRWAMQAKIGDTIHFVGPGNKSDLNLQADWFFMVADMTALPALSAKIRTLPPSASGYAVIQVIDNDDIQPINVPKNMELIWLTKGISLVDKVKSLPWLAGDAAVWSATEFDDMRALRHYFRQEKLIPREHIYISSYWKQGVTEDGHRELKQQDATAVA